MTRPLVPRVDSSSSLALLSSDFSERLGSSRVFQLPSEISSPLTMNRRFPLALLSIVLAIALVSVLLIAVESGIDWRLVVSTKSGKATPFPALHRKLLVRGVEPDRIDGERCTKGDIVINQGPTAPLPNGIPTYTVEIMNACVTGCNISRIHLACGWFSSARLVNPRVFKRLRYNDCLVNDGKTLLNGGTLSFQYANTFLYPLEVSHVVCY